MADTKKTNDAPEALEVRGLGEAAVLKYRNVIIGVIAAIVVCLGVAFFVKNCTQEQFNTSSTEMAKAQEFFMRAVADEDSLLYEKALNGDSINSGFLAIAEGASSGKVANLAKLYAGLCYAHLGNMQEATTYLEQFDTADDAMVSPAAIGALGDVKASMDQLDEAAALFVKAAEKADNNSLSPLFLIKAGEILESQGKKAEALKLYEQIKSKYANSPQYRTIDAYIERAKE